MAVHPLTQEPEPFKQMQQTIHLWGAVSVLLGGIAVIFGLLGNPAYSEAGIILLIIGGLTFYFDTEPAILIVYTSCFVWNCVVGGLTQQTGWLLVLVVQGALAVMAFRGFKMHSASQAAAAAAGDTSWPQSDARKKAPKWFPGLSLGLSLTGAVLFAADVIVYDLLSYGADREFIAMTDAIHTLALRLAAPAIGFGVAALVCRFKKELASGIGILVGLVLTVWAVTMKWPF